MKTPFKAYIILCLSALILIGCSRKNDSFVSRNFHAVTTEYNTLHNGYNALEQGRKSLNEGYTDNYWEILPVERMQVSDEIVLPGQSKNADFERAEEKAVKAVQKHGMNINGKEKNPQIDEAYLLLGKSRYFDQRFVPAMEAFNYILYKYPASDKISQARIWREKSNLRLENTELAITNLKRLMYQEELEGKDLADATSMLAEGYIAMEYLDSAITQLEIASKATKSNDERGRYRFIQGQLYNALKKPDSANYAFDRVIELNRKTPRIYLISAHIEKAKNFDFESGNKLEFLELLTELEENRENRPYLDKIYHQIAEYHLVNSSDTIAEKYYNKSLRTDSRDRFLNAMNHQNLGNMNFDNSEYKDAGAYYDSTMLNLKQNSKLYREIKRKRENLDDVIRYEDIAQRNDSILSLISLSDDQRLVYFTEYTDKLKQEAEEAKAKEEIAKQNAATGLKTSGNNSMAKGIGAKGKQAPNIKSFYFYNPVTVAFGKNEFSKIWGNRSLEDNWRWSSKSNAGSSSQSLGEEFVDASEEELFDPEFYISKIPTEQTAIDSLAKDRNFAYYQLGLIYKDKFKEYVLAKDKLKALLESNPEERLILPAKYNLHKLYVLLNQSGEAEIAKNDIINNHPDSRYAAILLNPDSNLGEDENSPENIYEGLYKQFEAQNYATVISESDTYIRMFDGEAIVPKFEFLKAVANARLFGFEAYKKAINYIALNYPNSPEGKQAETMMQGVMPMLEKKTFVDEASSKNFKVIYSFKDASKEEIEEFANKLNESIEVVRYFDLSSSIDKYNANTTFVVVHGLTSLQGAQGFKDILRDYKKTIERNHFSISSDNYEVIQIHKNLDAYIESQ
ncbi:MAG: tetratricopeptide (TPR) repeat protein [Glaciecola sp.]